MKSYNYKNLDDIIHSRIRLAIISVLLGIEHAEFNYIKKSVDTTDGNLSVHLKKLEEAGYVDVKKEFVERKPVSSYRLTSQGHNAFEEYVKMLESFIK